MVHVLAVIKTKPGMHGRHVVVERREHFIAHAWSEHMAAYAAEVKDMLADRTIHILESA